jgi:3-ketosteroid 9alpha-monooxygenase subunit A
VTKSLIPTGWFQVGWSADLKPGDIKPLHYFGRDLVCYRGNDSGAVIVLDAYCPHLGAHLGYPFDNEVPGGGKRDTVEGDNIRCPWHQWLWTPQGRCAEVPYSERPFRGLGPQPWHVRDVNGFILVWFDALGREPSWEPPVIPELQPDCDHYPIHPWAVRDFRNLNMRAQNVVENSADFSHLRYVHRHTGEIFVLGVETEGPFFSTKISTVFKTPEGDVTGTIQPFGWGVGLLHIRLCGIHDITHIANATPIDGETTDWFTAVAVKRFPGEEEPPARAHAILQAEHREAQRDIHIWTHARWVDRPPFPREEAEGFRALRTWADQFYPELPEDAPAPVAAVI